MTQERPHRLGGFTTATWLAFSLAVTSLAACQDGKDGGGDGDGDSSGDGDGGDSGDGDATDSEKILTMDTPGGVQLSCEDGADLAPTPLLKLSTQQYKNTVFDLLDRFGIDDGVAAAPMGSIPSDALGDSFRGLDERVDSNHVQGFFQVSVAIADAISSDDEILEDVVGSCATSDFDQDCWDGFVGGFLELVYRRPLSDEERADYDELFEQSLSAADAVRSSVIVALSSPRFVYHVEVDGSEVDDDLLTLDAFEVASRLSYTFWQTMPDEELFEAARDGSLLEEDTYGEQLKRVWEDPRTEATLGQFWEEWLRLEKFTGFESSRPAFRALSEGYDFDNHDYYDDMVKEVLDLTHHFTFESPATLSELLTTNISVTRSAELAELYGVDPWDGSGDFPRFEVGERAGLLQRAALLVSNLEQTNPFHRGALIRRAVLCDSLPQPDPNDLPPGSLDPPPVDEAQTTRERFAAKVEGNGLCEDCHKTFSDIGYALENYDALGRFRTEEQVFDEQTGELLAELSIDTTAQVALVSRNASAVNGAAELNQAIVDSGRVEACLAENYMSYFARRAIQSNSLDRCVIDDLSEALGQEDGGMEAAFQRLARVSTFFTKKVGPQ